MLCFPPLAEGTTAWAQQVQVQPRFGKTAWPRRETHFANALREVLLLAWQMHVMASQSFLDLAASSVFWASRPRAFSGPRGLERLRPAFPDVHHSEGVVKVYTIHQGDWIASSHMIACSYCGFAGSLKHRFGAFAVT